MVEIVYLSLIRGIKQSQETTLQPYPTLTIAKRGVVKASALLAAHAK